MNMNCSYPITMHESILAQMFVLLVLFTIFAFYCDNCFKPKLPKIFFYRKYVHLGENTLIHCGKRTVIHVHVNVFFKIHPACHSDASGIKQGCNQND